MAAVLKNLGNWGYLSKTGHPESCTGKTWDPRVPGLLGLLGMKGEDGLFFRAVVSFLQ